MGIKLMTQKDLNQAMHNIANYYRKSRLYLAEFNTDDAYDKYIEAYTHATSCIIEQGHCYKFKNNYLLALDLKQFESEHNEEFHHYFDCIYDWIEPYIEREKDPVLFICAVGPNGDFFTSDTYRLVNEFERMQAGIVLLTDCPVEIDFKSFPKYTRFKPVTIAGREYFRQKD